MEERVAVFTPLEVLETMCLQEIMAKRMRLAMIIKSQARLNRVDAEILLLARAQSNGLRAYAFLCRLSAYSLDDFSQWAWLKSASGWNLRFLPISPSGRWNAKRKANFLISIIFHIWVYNQY